jgi:hypothetical protein
MKLPEGINLQAAGGFIGDLSAKLGMSFQRLIIAATALLGLLLSFIPRYNVTDQAKMMMAMTGGGWPNPAYTIMGWVAAIVFIAAIGLCFLGNKGGTVGKLKGAFIACGVVNLLLGIFQFVAFNAGDYAGLNERNMGSIGFGLFPLIIFAVAVAVIPFIKKLEK